MERCEDAFSWGRRSPLHVFSSATAVTLGALARSCVNGTLKRCCFILHHLDCLLQA